MQEAELISAAQAGDRDALIELLRKLESPLYRTAFYMLGNEQDALDATQDALIKVYKNIQHFQQKAKLLTWAQRIMHNVCIDYTRQKKPMLSVDEHEHLLNQSDRHVEEEMERTIIAEDVQQAVLKLPDHLRQVIILRYVQDLAYKEIAETIQLPLNTVKSHLFRARKQLQQLLQEDEVEGGVSG